MYGYLTLAQSFGNAGDAQICIHEYSYALLLAVLTIMARRKAPDVPNVVWSQTEILWIYDAIPLGSSTQDVVLALADSDMDAIEIPA